MLYEMTLQLADIFMGKKVYVTQKEVSNSKNLFFQRSDYIGMR